MYNHPSMLPALGEDRRREIHVQVRRTRPIEEEHREPLRRRLRLRRRDQAPAPVVRKA